MNSRYSLIFAFAIDYLRSRLAAFDTRTARDRDADCNRGCGEPRSEGNTMSKTIVAPRTKTKTKTARPPLYKVILLNDDYTPREFVVLVLKAVFRMSGDQAYRVMMTAHQRGVCVIAVYTRDVAETKAKEATELGKSKGYPLFFTTEPEQ
jgi:ATP-dependent Clp protease adaptor protein ClpS